MPAPDVLFQTARADDLCNVTLHCSQDVIITGDFNADCDYVRPSYWPTIRLRTDKRFLWLTPDSADTTVSSTTDCAYDR